MSEPLVDPRSLLRGLHAHEVHYLVTGAVAMTFYGYVRLTEDLDVIVDPDEPNLDRVADWLIEYHGGLHIELQDEDPTQRSSTPRQARQAYATSTSAGRLPFEEFGDPVRLRGLQQAFLEPLVQIREPAVAQLLKRPVEVVLSAPQLDIGAEQRPVRAGSSFVGHADAPWVHDTPAVERAVVLLVT